MDNFVSSLNNFTTQQAKLNEKTDNAIQQLQAQNKLMENQFGQLAQQVGQLSKTQGQFPGNTEQPPKGHINVVILWSGKELENPPSKEPSKKIWKR